MTASVEDGEAGVAGAATAGRAGTAATSGGGRRDGDQEWNGGGHASLRGA